jgi:hypothetical protein
MNEKEQKQHFQNIIEQHKGILHKVARAILRQTEK